LLGLDEELHTARKKTPSRNVVQGSVAIGGTQTGIYPQDSPGGWHVIGHCPIPLFDIHFPQQSLLRQGDHLQFKAISIDEHVSLSKMSLHEFVNSSFVFNG
jgi:allophanate hydrolase subunit 1